VKAEEKRAEDHGKKIRIFNCCQSYAHWW